MQSRMNRENNARRACRAEASVDLTVAGAKTPVSIAHTEDETESGKIYNRAGARAQTHPLKVGGEETIILEFLRANPETAFARKEIARKAIRRSEYESNPRWADTPLQTLVARNLVEVDNGGLYRLRGRSAF